MGYEVVLIAPRDHIAKHPLEAGHFDFTITYEEIARFVPEFGEACSPAAL